MNDSPLRSRAFPQPTSGYYRIACCEPCRLSTEEQPDSPAVVWNVSVRGAYLVLSGGLPAVGSPVRLVFALPGDDGAPIACQARVCWLNPPSIFDGLGAVARGLPPGCGVEFAHLEDQDRDRIEDHVKRTQAAAAGALERRPGARLFARFPLAPTTGA